MENGELFVSCTYHIRVLLLYSNYVSIGCLCFFVLFFFWVGGGGGGGGGLMA